MSADRTTAARGGIAAPQPPVGTRLDTLGSLPVVLQGWRGLHSRSIAWNGLVHVAAAVAAGAAAHAVAVAVTGRAEQLWLTTVLVLTATALRSVAVWREAYTSHDLAFRVLARVRTWIFRALARISPAGVADRRTGDVAAATTTDAEQLEIFYAHSSLYLVGRWMITPVLLGAVALIDPVAAAATLPLVLLTAVVPLVARRHARRQGSVRRRLLARMSADMDENAGAVREIAAAGLQQQRADRLDGQHQALVRSFRASATQTGLEAAVTGVTGAAIAVVVTAVGVARVRSGDLDLTWLPALVAVAAVTPIAVLQWVAVTRHQGNLEATARRIEAVLEAPETLPVTDAVEIPPIEGAADIEATDLRFTWPGGRRPAVDGVTLRVPAGQTIALAGRSGAGKSTLGQLLARWHDPDSGEVRIGGAPLRRVRREHLHRLVTLLPQEPYLFAETVRANLALARDEAIAEPELWCALETAGAAELVRSLPDGLDTVLADRARSLSGGERQRLALARLLLVPAPVLVLDEAVSQLDTTTETGIRDAVARTGRTTVVIAHRLATLLHSDRIVVMDRGRIVGDGSHEELWRDCPAYRDLVAPQLDGLRTLTSP